MLIFIYEAGKELRLMSFAYGCLIAPAPFIKEIVFVLLNYLVLYMYGLISGV